MNSNEHCCLTEAPSHGQTALREVLDERSEAFLQEMVKEEHFSGVALVMRKGSIVHAQGYGEANRAGKNSLDTIFHVASITKQFTAVAIMQLVEAGTIDLGKSIKNYLPYKFHSKHWDTVKVSHLLSHTSGIPDYAILYNVFDGFCLGNTINGMIEEAMAKKLEFEPGSRFFYSNIGFTLLGEMIEHQTSMPYEEYLKVKVLEPMGMDSSRVHGRAHVPSKNEASGHRWDNKRGKPVPDDIVSLPVTAPDGGLTTTLADFVKWSQIYIDGEAPIISRQSLTKMTTAEIPTEQKDARDTPQAYGYGLFIGDGLLSHPGYIVGFKSHFIVDPTKKLLIAIFSNNTTNEPQRISTGLLQIADAERES